MAEPLRCESCGGTRFRKVLFVYVCVNCGYPSLGFSRPATRCSRG